MTVDAQNLLNLIEGDGGHVYRDDEIIVTPKRVVFREEWIKDPSAGIYLIENIRRVNAMQSISWPGVVWLGIFSAGALYFGWMWAAVLCAGLGFLVWKFMRDGDLFLDVGSSDDIHIPSRYSRVIQQKEAIESQRSPLRTN